jgi:Protein of unknown function (DUF3558)
MRSTRLGRIVVATVLLALAGCSSTVTGSAAPEGALPPEAPIASAENQAGGPTGAGAVDACALLSAADVTPLVGKGVSGQPNPVSGDGGKCTWENQDDYHSVTLEVGANGSAPGGALPKWDTSIGPERPLPDGMRSWSGGQVEFLAGSRDCFLQVATTGAASDEQKAVELAGKVRGQL